MRVGEVRVNIARKIVNERVVNKFRNPFDLGLKKLIDVDWRILLRVLDFTDQRLVSFFGLFFDWRLLLFFQMLQVLPKVD